jgi:GNAT superfamily N-acetyltransferase
VTPPVRVAGPEDAPIVAELLVAWRDYMGRDWPPPEAIRTGVERLIGREDSEYLLGGEAPDGIVQLRYRYGIWLDAEDCLLEDLFVRPQGHGRGTGKALVAAAIERARRRGCRRLELDVDEHNAPARALYESLGFRSGGGEPGRYSLFMRHRIVANMPPGVD